MISPPIHVVGAGLAGLSAAVRLAEAGQRVVLYEAAKQAGGRCRSYEDAALGLTIDNGNHLLLSGNHAALDYARLIGGEDALSGPGEAVFDFADLRSGERWQLRPNGGRLPWWIFDRRRRVPGSRPRDYLAALGLLRAKPGATVCEAMDCTGPLYERLWQPVLLAALNTDPAEASAALAATIIRETLGAGGRACRPVIATGGLSAAFVDPALAFLRARGTEIRFGARLRRLHVEQGRVAALNFGDGTVPLGRGEQVVLALPSAVAQEVLPGLAGPTDFRAIVNAHFRILPPPGSPPLLGIVGGLSEWLFAYPDRLSVTISGADRLLDTPRDELAMQIWREVAALSGLAAGLPPWQIVKERRATFAATPSQEAMRPGPTTSYPNLVLAGDWIANGLPATIEGSIRSGRTAAELLLRSATSAARQVETVP